LLEPSPTPALDMTPYRLSTAYSVHSQFHPQPEDAPCRVDMAQIYVNMCPTFN